MTQYDQRLPKHLQGSFLVSIDTHFHMRVAVKQCHKMFFCYPRNLDWCNSSITMYTTTKVITIIPHHHLCPHKSSACHSSSMAWLLQVCKFSVHYMSVDLRPLLRQVHTASVHERTHLQERSCCTVSGTGEPRTHSTARFLSSSVVQPQSVGLGTNAEGSKHLCPMVAQRDGSDKVEVDLRACSVGGFLQFFFSESSSDTYHERPSSVKASL